MCTREKGALVAIPWKLIRVPFAHVWHQCEIEMVVIVLVLVLVVVLVAHTLVRRTTSEQLLCLGSCPTTPTTEPLPCPPLRAPTKMATTRYQHSLHIGNRSPEHHQRSAGRPPVLSNRSNNGTLVAELGDHNAHRNPECHRRSAITSMTNTQRDTYSAH